jgi:hypothetical protein
MRGGFLEVCDVFLERFSQSPPEFAMADLITIHTEVLEGREGVCFSDPQEEGKATKFPAVGTHDIVEVEHVITAIV